MDELQNVRKEINQIDDEIAKLFSQRMDAVKKVVEYKISHGLKILDESREKQIILKASQRIENEEYVDYYIDFIKATMDISKAYQRKIAQGIKVAYCGEIGAFNHIACKKIFPQGEYVPANNFIEAYKLCEDGKVDTLVLPLENSYEGEVGAVSDLIFSGSLHINDIESIQVRHNLLALPGTKLEDIKLVVSHPQALGQCKEYLSSLNVSIKEYANTALAARDLKSFNDKSIAVIASIEAAKEYGLEVLEKNINTSLVNQTRFGVFSRHLNKLEPSLKDNIASIIVFTLKNEAGSLASALNIIGSHGINMRTIRSRLKKDLMWSYYFYLELECNIFSRNGQELLQELSSICSYLKLVGTYTIK